MADNIIDPTKTPDQPLKIDTPDAPVRGVKRKVTLDRDMPAKRLFPERKLHVHIGRDR